MFRLLSRLKCKDYGKQVYLGGFDTIRAAARAYDRAAIKFWSIDTNINFNLSDYKDDMKQMKSLSNEEFVHACGGRAPASCRAAPSTEASPCTSAAGRGSHEAVTWQEVRVTT